MGEITLEIDGREVKVEEETTILEAAKSAGIHIPTLCYHPALSPFGACRLCSVEIISRGRSRIVTSCNYPVEEGLIINTKSPDVIEARKMIIELMLARCPNVKTIQDLAKEYGVEKPRFELEDEKCILCGLCARVCEERIGVSAINFVGRGVERKVETPFQGTLDINLDACIACGACASVCPTGAITLEDITGKKPVPIPSEFEMGLRPRSPVYIPFPQAVPNVPVIDRGKCVHFLTGECGICRDLCEAEAINFEQDDEVIELDVGAIVMATGYYVPDASNYEVYGGGKYPDVITSLQLERLMSSFGPTGGEIVRPSDGAHPKKVVFIGCVGSRDEKTGHGYCSRVCCMYMAKHAIMLKEHDPEVQSYIFYPSVRGPGGKMFEEFLERAEEAAGTVYLRGEITDVYQEDGKMMVCGKDLEKDESVKLDADLVVLAAAMVPSSGATQLARTLNISYDERDFMLEAHPKLRPVETSTDGIFLAGTCTAPFDIPESVAQGGAAAAQVVTIFGHDTLSTEPLIATVNAMTCAGCLLCADVCPFKAIDSEVQRDGRTVAVVNESICKGCGLCVAVCRSGAAGLRGFAPQQLFAEVTALWR